MITGTCNNIIDLKKDILIKKMQECILHDPIYKKSKIEKIVQSRVL